ncbi:mobile mystery protein B [Brenneria tiliae]|nr:mobile mystery protein B [Brenneria tiliae]
MHKRMFDETWQWAGRFRIREVNIGNTPPHMISTQVRNALDNVAYWVKNNTFKIDEICLRLHRDIVWIHPFPNGNGRHSRIFCDILRQSLGYEHFSWGNNSGNLASSDAQRLEYIAVLKEAVRGDYERLLKFATSAR